MSSLSIHGGVARKGPRTRNLSDFPLPIIQMCNGILFKMDCYSTFFSFFFFLFVKEWFAVWSHEYEPCKDELRLPKNNRKFSHHGCQYTMYT